MRVLLLMLCLTGVAFAQGALQKRIQQIARNSGMRVGAYVKILDTGEVASVDGDRPYPLASVFKLPIMVEIARQNLPLSSKLVITEREKCIGSGRLQDQPNGTAVRVDRLIELMETVSDNTATDMLFRKIGLDSVNKMMDSIGCLQTDIFLTNRAAWLISLGQSSDFRGLDPRGIAAKWKSMTRVQRRQAAERAEAENRGLTLRQFQAIEDRSAATNTHAEDVLVATTVDNMSSPTDLGILLEKLIDGKILDERWTEYCLGVLSRQRFNTRIPRLLPNSVRVLHKTGTIAGVVNDAGILELPNGRTVVVVVLVSQVGSGQSSRAERVIADVALAAYQVAAK